MATIFDIISLKRTNFTSLSNHTADSELLSQIIGLHSHRLFIIFLSVSFLSGSVESVR